MELNQHRQAIVRTILCGLRTQLHKSKLVPRPAFQKENDSEHFQRSTCSVTKLFFPDHLAEMQTTCSNYGDIWTGLWLDVPLKLDDERPDGHGNTLFPRWLAEVLNEFGLGVEEGDIYD